MQYREKSKKEIQSQNVTVHRAAANDIDLRNRAARGSVCNGLFGLPVICRAQGGRQILDVGPGELKNQIIKTRATPKPAPAVINRITSSV